MTPEMIMLIIAIAEKVVKYGPEAAIKIMTAWGISNPTLADIQALRDLKPASDYFDNPGGDTP